MNKLYVYTTPEFAEQVKAELEHLSNKPELGKEKRKIKFSSYPDEVYPLVFKFDSHREMVEFHVLNILEIKWMYPDVCLEDEVMSENPYKVYLIPKEHCDYCNGLTER
jgi:hypothetical protein